MPGCACALKYSSYSSFKFVRNWSLITGRGLQNEKGGGENLSHAEWRGGGQKKVWGSFPAEA